MIISSTPVLQTKPNFGRLERVDLRAGWVSEAQDFTPWLANEENIALVGEAIGLELEKVSAEVGVGPYRADILCKETANDSWVLIENQLERTDHIHLGQILTYAASLEAVTVVWIARTFTDEHRAALDWLNKITEGNFNFFGLEIQLWRIGDSPIAPRFNVVSQPNDWAQTVRRTAESRARGATSGTGQLHLEYWSQLKEFFQERGSLLKLPSPPGGSGIRLSLGRSNFSLEAWNITTAGRSEVDVAIRGPRRWAQLQLLRRRSTDLERQLGLGPLSWTDTPGKPVSRAWLSRTSNPRDRTSWPELNLWFAETLERMDAVFRPIVKTLDPDNDVSEDAGSMALEEP